MSTVLIVVGATLAASSCEPKWSWRIANLIGIAAIFIAGVLTGIEVTQP